MGLRKAFQEISSNSHHSRQLPPEAGQEASWIPVTRQSCTQRCPAYQLLQLTKDFNPAPPSRALTPSSLPPGSPSQRTGWGLGQKGISLLGQTQGHRLPLSLTLVLSLTGLMLKLPTTEDGYATFIKEQNIY